MEMRFLIMNGKNVIATLVPLNSNTHYLKKVNLNSKRMRKMKLYTYEFLLFRLVEYNLNHI